MKEELSLVANEPKSILIAKGNNDKIDTKVNIPDSIDAPIKQDKVIGEIEYNLNGKLVEKVKVRAKEDIEECSFANSFRYLWAFLVSL